MTNSPAPITQRKIPTRREALIFRGKTLLLQINRGIRDLFATEIKTFPKSRELTDQAVIATSKTPLWTATEPEEQFLLAGKIHNLRPAIWLKVSRPAMLKVFAERSTQLFCTRLLLISTHKKSPPRATNSGVTCSNHMQII